MSKQWINQSVQKYGNESIEVVIPLIVSTEQAIIRHEYSTAIKQIDRALEIMNKASGWLYPDYALALNYKAFCLLMLDQTFQAISLVDEAEMIYIKTLSKEHPDNIYCSINRAIIHQNFKEYEESEKLFIKSRIQNFNHEKERIGFENSIDDEWIQLHMANMFIASYNKNFDVIKTLTELKENYESKGRERNPSYLDLLSTIGDAYYMQGQFKLSEKYYNKCLTLRKEIFGQNHISTLKVYFKLADVYKEENKFTRSEEYFKLVVDKFDHVNGDPLLLKEAYLHLSDIYLKKGNTKTASHYLEKGEHIQSYDLELRFFELRLRGEIHLIKGEYVQSELRFTELLSIVLQEKIFFTQHYTEALCSLSELFLMVGRFSDARTLCERELAFLKRRKLDNSAVGYLVQTVLYKCELYQNPTIDITDKVVTLESDIKKLLNNSHSLLIKTQQLLGDYHFNTSSFDKAFRNYQSAEKLADALEIDVKYYIRLQIKFKKVDILNSKKEYELAYNELKTLENTFDNFSIHKPTIISKMAYTNSMLGKWDLAEKMILDAVDLKFKQLNEQLIFTSEDEKINFIHHSSAVFTYFFSLMTTDQGMRSSLMREKCYDLQVNYRKYFLKESIQRKENIKMLSKYRQKVEFTNYTNSLKKLKSQLATANFFSVEERKKIDFDCYGISDRINNLEKSLVYATYDKNDSSVLNQDLTWQSTQERLKNGEIAIEILKLKNIIDTKVSYGAVIISKELERPKFVPIGNAKILEVDVLDYYHQIVTMKTRSLIVTDEPKRNINAYDFYWKPIRKVIDDLGIKSDKIYLSNDGIYNSINLNILTNPETKKYVIDEENIHFVMSTADIHLQKEKKVINKEIILVGDPVFQVEEVSSTRGNTDENTRQAYYFNLYNLPGTAKEIQNTADLFKEHDWNVVTLNKLNATEKNVKNIHTSPYIIHLATHGFYLDQLKNPIISSPLLKSGLFFSEITFKNEKDLKEIYDEGNDGILTAYEVKGLNLKDTELLVLSACQSGLSDITSGDGISGLQYAFSIAGVNTIIMSLWSVDDYATQLLMNEFYRQWIKTKDKTVAFRLAQKEVIKTYPNPYYWGAFVMVD
ncbi:CHAT domain-containing protein [Flammeovirga sp. MY04]|uniref:CHAT domain-containing protein n=1 Tax=Flammeovirga sp. MY04 TaxID=1191459 RepID=UPI0008062484|nr:CHAT domain-containing protein [Flammeovirga sp. MY04]ANQ49350.1 CHAT domain-containing protein [Flammeovirga sp. MY04]